ncbi:MAG: MFS transporter [SAR202 cluster bacterium]|nr:MFS transporter [SAR202 cluster bacterium]
MNTNTKFIIHMQSKWMILIVAALGNLVLTVDSGLMPITYPELATVFNTDTSTILWISVAFWVTTVGLGMTIGWLVDVRDKRIIYTLGFVIFSLALMLASLTSSLWQLILVRIFMGVGSAMILAGVNAIIVNNFHGHERAKAIGFAGAVVGIGLSGGPIFGGFLLDYLDWRSLFYSRIPISIVAGVLSWLVLQKQDVSEENHLKVEWIGVVSLFAVLASLILIFNRGAQDGWNSPVVLIMVVVLLISLPVLLQYQRRSKRPILDLPLFKITGYGFGLIILMCHYISLGAIMLLASFFFIDNLGFSATKAGVFIMLYSLMRVFIAPFTGYILRFISPWHLSAVGLGLICASLVWFSFLSTSGSESSIFIALLLIGIGSGIYEPPNTLTIMSSVPSDRYGTASASIASGRQLAFALGVAMCGAINAGREKLYNLGEVAQSDYLSVSFSYALIACAIFAGIGLVLSFIAANRDRRAINKP